MSPIRPVFIISDHTGITAEIIGKSILSQFSVDAGVKEVLARWQRADVLVNNAGIVRDAQLVKWKDGAVVSTMTDAEARAVMEATGALVMDVYGHFLGMMIGELGRPAVPLKGKSHSASDTGAYHGRIDAVNYALSADDGLSVQKYDRADLILIGVSRCGKTPTSLYMAMQYGMKVANYPLTPENFERPGLPECLHSHLRKLRGLTLKADRLSQIRSERLPNSTYAALETCQQELASAEKMMNEAGIPILDSSARSIEEIAALLRQSLLKPGK